MTADHADRSDPERDLVQMKRAELKAAAGATGALIDRIRAGTLNALPQTLHRLEGARLVLELLADGEADPAALVARLEDQEP